MSLREAAQQALEAMACMRDMVAHPDNLQFIDNAITALRTALAEPEQEQKHIGPEWVPCVKLPVTVHVREQRPGEAHVSTREGITPIRPDDLIMRGVAGEEYPIGRELFNRTYRLGEQRTEPEQEPVQVTPLDFVTAVLGKEDCVGRPIMWAEWPNRAHGIGGEA
jgi:hypothetical protein